MRPKYLILGLISAAAALPIAESAPPAADSTNLAAASTSGHHDNRAVADDEWPVEGGDEIAPADTVWSRDNHATAIVDEVEDGEIEFEAADATAAGDDEEDGEAEFEAADRRWPRDNHATAVDNEEDDEELVETLDN